MASVTKFCNCIRLDAGCVLIGLIAFILSNLINLIPITYFIHHNDDDFKAKNTTDVAVLLLNFINLNGKTDFKIQEFLFICLSIILWAYILSCFALWIGVSRKKTGLILLFAGYTTFVIIMGILTFVLLMVHKYWMFATAILLVTLIYIYFDMMVIVYYEFLIEELNQQRFHVFINTDTDLLVSIKEDLTLTNH